MKVFVGCDNGITGSIGIISDNEIKFFHTPIKKELSYTKKKQWISRIDGNKLYTLLQPYADTNTIVSLERPMINPLRWKASMSAIRALEATLIVVESLNLSYSYLDSKQWQKKLLPAGLKKEEIKEASLQIGKRTFPQVDFKGFKDADGLLIAHYLKEKSGN